MLTEGLALLFLLEAGRGTKCHAIPEVGRSRHDVRQTCTQLFCARWHETFGTGMYYVRQLELTFKTRSAFRCAKACFSKQKQVKANVVELPGGFEPSER